MNDGLMAGINLADVKAEANKELYEERFRAAVEQEKERLKNKKSFLDLLPFRIRIERVTK